MEDVALSGPAIGLRIAQLREHMGLSSRRLGERAELSHSYIELLEAGGVNKPRKPTLRALAKALGWRDYQTMLSSEDLEPSGEARLAGGAEVGDAVDHRLQSKGEPRVLQSGMQHPGAPGQASGGRNHVDSGASAAIGWELPAGGRGGSARGEDPGDAQRGGEHRGSVDAGIEGEAAMATAAGARLVQMRRYAVFPSGMLGDPMSPDPQRRPRQVEHRWMPVDEATVIGETGWAVLLTGDELSNWSVAGAPLSAGWCLYCNPEESVEVPWRAWEGHLVVGRDIGGRLRAGVLRRAGELGETPADGWLVSTDAAQMAEQLIYQDRKSVV